MASSIFKTCCSNEVDSPDDEILDQIGDKNPDCHVESEVLIDWNAYFKDLEQSFPDIDDVVQQKQKELPHAYTVVLDLDETLIHGISKQIKGYEEIRKKYLLGEVKDCYEIDRGDQVLILLKLRPFLATFLEKLFTLYNVGVFSAAGRIYVENVCKIIFPHEKLQPIFFLSNEHCRYLGSIPTKPLNSIPNYVCGYKFDVTRMILLDNCKDNALYFPKQFVHAPDYRLTQQEVEDDDYLLEKCLAEIKLKCEDIETTLASKKNDQIILNVDVLDNITFEDNNNQEIFEMEI